jgi:1,4-alpha-glucan branching enzyme
MAPIGGGHWAGFVPGLKDGDQYLFYVEGTGSSGFKRDPRARLLTHQPSFPACNSVLRNAARFPWRQERFVPPAFNDLVLYQLHVGTFSIAAGNGDGKFLDVDPARAPSCLARHQCARTAADPGIPDHVQHGLQRHRSLQP